MKHFDLRLDPELFVRIEALAHTERRSINQQMLWLLERGFVAEQYKGVLPAHEDKAGDVATT